MASVANPAPRVFDVSGAARRTFGDTDLDDGAGREAVDALEVFELIRRVRDPEHPVSLEQLKVVSADLVSVDDAAGTVDVQFTPTVHHCTLATLIGLSIRVKLLRSLPRRFKIRITLTPGSHSTEEDGAPCALHSVRYRFINTQCTRTRTHTVNKQLNDKERIAAAMENPALLKVINSAISDTD